MTVEPSGVTEKRGRGRPRKDNALTPAQRAKRYRDMKRMKAALAAAQARYELLAGMRPIKYRGPNGETWSGRGVMPRWVTCALERGHTLAELEALARGSA